MTEHPIRNIPVNVYYCERAAQQFRAFFGEGYAFPIFFDADTHEGAKAAAEAFRADVLAKHEGKYIARQEALGKARAARAARGKP